RTHILRRRRDRHSPGAVVSARQPALGDLRADTRLRVERRDPRAASAKLLRERALRGEFHFEFTGEELTLELLVLPHVRRRHFADAAIGQQNSETPVVDAAVVA